MFHVIVMLYTTPILQALIEHTKTLELPCTTDFSPSPPLQFAREELFCSCAGGRTPAIDRQNQGSGGDG